MKKGLVLCVLMGIGLICVGSSAWAVDTGWMKKGVRVWYFGAASTGFSSDAEEAYLLAEVDGTSVQVTKHAGINHWGSTQPVEASAHSALDKGPCWIHPQTLQNLKSGDAWKGQTIATVIPGTFTYATFVNQFPSFPYLLLPIKALFDLKTQRNLVKIVYYIDQFSTGIAYFDAETGLLLVYETSNGYVTTFFILSEINYDFKGKFAFVEDKGPHTGFKSNALETTSAAQYVFMQSSVESRYGDTIQMWVSTSAGGGSGIYMPPNENYCFFGGEPVLRRKLMTDTPQYPPELWNEYGKHLWWWVPQTALQSTAIDVFNVSMARTSTAPYTFTATGTGTGLFFSKIIFDNDGYMTTFFAKDSGINLDFTVGTIVEASKNTTVEGLAYYKNHMGTAAPDPDGDHDGMPDKWEATYFGNTSRDGTGDYDHDGLNDLQEYRSGTSPTDTDSDDDGLTDGLEVNSYGTNPTSKDTDGDAMPDGWEVQYGLNPIVNDATGDKDRDGFTNLQEYKAGTDPANPASRPKRAMPWIPALLDD